MHARRVRVKPFHRANRIRWIVKHLDGRTKSPNDNAAGADKAQPLRIAEEDAARYSRPLFTMYPPGVGENGKR